MAFVVKYEQGVHICLVVIFRDCICENWTLDMMVCSEEEEGNTDSKDISLSIQ